MKRTGSILLVVFTSLSTVQCRDPYAAHMKMGQEALSEGRPPEAIASYAAAVRLRPNAGDAHFNLGYSHYQAGDFAQAAQAFETASRHMAEGSRAASLYNLGNGLARQGRFTDALSAYRASLRLAPGNDDARYNYALVKAWLDRDAGRQGAGRGDKPPQGGRLTPEDARRALDRALSDLEALGRSRVRGDKPDW